MDPHLHSTSSSLPVKEPISTRTLFLQNFLHEKAVDLQTRENRQDPEFIRELLGELEQIKFECLNLKGEICDLFVNISKKAEICEQQMQISGAKQTSKFGSRRRKRRNQKLRESFGFSEFKGENNSETEMSPDASEDEEPEYLRHFQMAKQRNEEAIWGGKTRQIEGDALEMRSEFRDVKYTVLSPAEDFTERIQMVKEWVQ